MFYKDRVFFNTLTFDAVFENATDFEDKLSALTDLDLTALMPFDDLYYTLALKYVGAHTRYTDEFSFIMALIRELKIVWPIYKLQKSLMDDLMGLKAAEVKNITNHSINMRSFPFVSSMARITGRVYPNEQMRCYGAKTDTLGNVWFVVGEGDRLGWSAAFYNGDKWIVMVEG